MAVKPERLAVPADPRVAGLEAEIERLEDQIAEQEFYLLGGYIVSVTPLGDGTFIASCPTRTPTARAPFALAVGVSCLGGEAGGCGPRGAVDCCVWCPRNLVSPELPWAVTSVPRS